MKKRIAIWIHGGVGSGLASQGQPIIMRLIQWLATQYAVDVYSLLPPNDGFLPSDFSLYSAGKQKQMTWLGWLKLSRTFLNNHRAEKYDCLYSFWGYPSGVVAYMIGKLINRPAILHLQGGDTVGLPHYSYGVFRNRFRAVLCRLAYNGCAALIALTEFQKSFLNGNKIRRTVHVVPYGVNEKMFSFSIRLIPDRLYKFIHVGNLTPIKGQEMMLMTFAKICKHIPAELTIVGPEYDAGLLKQIVKNLAIEDHVRFVDHQLYHDLPSFYRDAHVLLHTSVYEGQGVVYAEAASCGTLLAGTRVGQLADMGEDCGICVEYGEHELLASKIVDTLRSTEKFRNYVHAAKAWTHQHDEQNTFRKIKAIIDDTIPKH